MMLAFFEIFSLSLSLSRGQSLFILALATPAAPMMGTGKGAESEILFKGVLVPHVDVGMFSWLPMLAGAAMAMSSVTVVGNLILLGRYRSKFATEKPGGKS